MVVGQSWVILCEIGNASILMPGARLGDRIFLGEGTLVPSGMTLPSDVVAVGRPARVIRYASADDLARLLVLRGGDLSVPPTQHVPSRAHRRTIAMGQLYAYRDVVPTVARVGLPLPYGRDHRRRGHR